MTQPLLSVSATFLILAVGCAGLGNTTRPESISDSLCPSGLLLYRWAAPSSAGVKLYKSPDGMTLAAGEPGVQVLPSMVQRATVSEYLQFDGSVLEHHIFWVNLELNKKGSARIAELAGRERNDLVCVCSDVALFGVARPLHGQTLEVGVVIYDSKELAEQLARSFTPDEDRH